MDIWNPKDPEISKYIQSVEWNYPAKRTHFLTDLHADYEAFIRSMVATGEVEKTGDGPRDFKVNGDSKWVIGGDCFNKGPSNLKLLDAVQHLIGQAEHVHLIAGNHDLRTLLGIQLSDSQDPRHAHLFVRMGRRSVPLFKEIWDEYDCPQHDLSDMEVESILFPNNK